jgi:anti-sigma B factor antagonist
MDLETAPLVREVMLQALEHRTGPVIVDVSEVAFMDSTGVHVLVDALQQLTLENRRLAIACREGGQVHRLLAVVGLLDVLTVHRSRESAVSGGDDLLRADARVPASLA